MSIELDQKDVLKLQISIIFVRDRLTFINPISEYQMKLKRRFSVEYTQDEIETALNELEDQFLEEPEKVIEIPEDYELT